MVDIMLKNYLNRSPKVSDVKGLFMEISVNSTSKSSFKYTSIEIYTDQA